MTYLIPGPTQLRGVQSGGRLRPHAPVMFAATEEDEAAIRAVYQQRGEFAAAVELRQRFPGITDNAQARAALGPSRAGSRCHCGR